MDTSQWWRLLPHDVSTQLRKEIRKRDHLIYMENQNPPGEQKAKWKKGEFKKYLAERLKEKKVQNGKGEK